MKQPRGLSINWDFAILLVFMIGLNLPLLRDSFIPVHDTLQTFEGFHYFYSHLYFFNSLPAWNPYEMYGMPAVFQQLIFISPSGYLVLFLGKLLGIQNALLLFKLAILGDQLLFLVGVYLLSRLLFKKRVVVFFVCAACIGSVVWYSQIWFNFRIYYLLPLQLFFLILFFRRKKPELLWVAATVFTISLFGNLMYFGVLWLALLLIFVVFMTVKHPDAWRSIANCSVGNGLSFMFFILLSTTYILLVFRFFQHVDLGVEGRDPLTGKTSLESFLYYGGRVDFKTLGHMFFYGWPVHTHWSRAMDNTAYIGLLPLLFIVFGLFVYKRNGIEFNAFLAMTLFLAWLSMAGFFSSLLYHVPWFSLFRHLGLIWGMMKFFLIIIAGYGFQAFLEKGKIRHLLIGAALMLFFAEIFNATHDGNGAYWWELDEPWAAAFKTRCLLYLIFVGVLTIGDRILVSVSFGRGAEKSICGSRFAMGLIIFFVLFDLMLFQRTANALSLPVPTLSQANMAIFEVAKPDLAMTRTVKPPDERAANIIEFFKKFPLWYEESAIDTTIYSFAQFSPLRNEFFAPRVPVRLKAICLDINRRFLNDASIPCIGMEQMLSRRMHFIRMDSAETRKDNRIESMGEGGMGERLEQRSGCNLPSRFFKLDETRLSFPKMDIIEWNDDRLAFIVRLDEPACLLFTDNYHPAWAAFIDGAPAKLEKANEVFMAVSLNRGTHHMSLHYKSMDKYGAYIVAIIGAGAAVGAILYCVMLLAPGVYSGYRRTKLAPDQAD